MAFRNQAIKIVKITIKLKGEDDNRFNYMDLIGNNRQNRRINIFISNIDYNPSISSLTFLFIT